MKRVFCIFICGCIFLLTIGCGAINATPTDKTVTMSKSDIVSKTIEEEKTKTEPLSSVNEAEQELESQTKETNVSKVTSEQKQENKTSSTKETVSSKEKEENTVSTVKPYDGAHADFKREYPTFYTENSLKGWLTNGTQMPDHRDELLTQISSGNTITYLRPMVTSDFTVAELCMIQVENTSILYYFKFEDDDGTADASLMVVAHAEDDFRELYTTYASHAEEKKEGYSTIRKNGIEYVVNRNEAFDSTTILWEQNGKIQSALLGKHFDQLNQVLSICNLESILIRTDVVTQ